MLWIRAHTTMLHGDRSNWSRPGTYRTCTLGQYIGIPPAGPLDRKLCPTHTFQVGGEGFLDKKILASMALAPGSGRLASWLVPPVQVVTNNNAIS